jgi:hypothetical protein
MVLFPLALVLELVSTPNAGKVRRLIVVAILGRKKAYVIVIQNLSLLGMITGYRYRYVYRTRYVPVDPKWPFNN